MLQTRQPLLLTHDTGAWVKTIGATIIPGTETSRSLMAVPILTRDQATGLIILQNYEREYAFSDADVRLLGTLAASLGVALENARLFDETKRLLEETRQRAAELAVINSVQQGLAAQLDIQAIYDLVGESCATIFDAQVIAISLYDHARRMASCAMAGKTAPRLRCALCLQRMTERLIETRQPLADQLRRWAAMAAASAIPTSPPAPGMPKSALFVPLIVGEQVNGVISLQNLDREDAFSEADVRLLRRWPAVMSVALENARLFDETQRLLEETAAAQRRAGRHQQRPAGPGGQDGHAGHLLIWWATRSARSLTPSR